MVSLVQEKCVACRADAPRVTEEEMVILLPQLLHWQVVDREGIPQLERTFPFKNFASALDFALRVGRVAEAEGHHPLLMVDTLCETDPPPPTWGKCTVVWWTRKIRGLHLNDFIMAAKTDRLYIADTNNHGIRVAELTSGEATTLKLVMPDR